MYREEKTFMLRFSLEATFPDDYSGEEDSMQWLREWEVRIKPRILKQVFEALRENGAWRCHVRNRGVSVSDEIEVVVSRDLSRPRPFSIQP